MVTINKNSANALFFLLKKNKNVLEFNRKEKFMESIILNNLNEEQKNPAMQTEGAVLVTAGAGSGKTRMLTHRIAYMVKELGISPNNILAITFTNKAANEMKERLEKMVDSLGDMWVCTFHAMCSKILRFNADAIGYSKSFSIYGDTEKNRVIKRILENKKTDLNVETFAWHISNAKNHLYSPERYSECIRDPKKQSIITSVYSEYEAELFKSSALDFDDLLVKCYELLKKNPEILEFYQNKFKYIHVDEFQDTNTSQYELVKLLAGKYKNVFAVGDEDQCIYSWRGAKVANVKQFTVDFEGCQIFKLEQNYRSTKKIITMANKLIKNNTSRIEKNLWTANEEGDDIPLKVTYSDMDEAELIAERIEYLTKEEGYKYSDFAILMRVNALSRIVEEKLLTYNIPYKVYGGFKFFERKEIKDTIAYLHLVANKNDNDAAIRMLGFPKKGIGDVSIAQLRALADENKVSIMDIIENAYYYGITGALANKLSTVQELFNDLNAKKETMEIVDYVTYVVERVGIKEAIGTKTEEDENKCLNIDDFLQSVSEYAEANEEATIDDFLQSITLMRDIDSMSEDDEFVSLITVHAAKGLEFNVVFLIGLNDGLFPLSRAINSTDPNELEEERRLMYVAITRAKKKLFMSRSKTKFNYQTKSCDYTLTSRFLEEIFDDLKNKPTAVSGETYKSTISASGFDKNLISNAKRQTLDELMSSRINVVNVSKKPQNSENSTSSTISQAAIKTADYDKFKKGTKVRHAHFGDGEITLGITDFASAFVTIKFDSVGIKTLSLKYAKLEIID